MEDNQKDVIKRLYELVAINSQTLHGNEEIINLLESWFGDYEHSVEEWVRDVDEVKGKNLVVKIPGYRSDHSIVFVCHMDTVPTSSAWETDPFNLEEIEGNLYGLGTCDTKGGVAALIEAVFTLPDKPNFDTYILFDGDEEEFSTGALKFKKKMHFKNPHFIFLEPTDGQLHIAQRGLLKFNIITHGTATHASQATPLKNAKGNAIYKMGKIIELLSEDAEVVAKEEDSYMGSNTQNFGVISGGTARNVFADKATLTIDRRLLPTRDPRKEFERLKELIVSKISDTDVLLEDTEPSFSTSENSEFVQKVLKYYRKVIPTSSIAAFPAWSEAGLFREYGDVVIMGPGSLAGQAHKANEFVSAQDLFHFVHIFQNIMREIRL